MFFLVLFLSIYLSAWPCVSGPSICLSVCSFDIYLYTYANDNCNSNQANHAPELEPYSSGTQGPSHDLIEPRVVYINLDELLGVCVRDKSPGCKKTWYSRAHAVSGSALSSISSHLHAYASRKCSSRCFQQHFYDKGMYQCINGQID